MTTYTHRQLTKAFNQVKNQEDWKNPINAIVPNGSFNVVVKAIEFFTNAKIRIVKTWNGYTQISSNGYRYNPCA